MGRITIISYFLLSFLLLPVCAFPSSVVEELEAKIENLENIVEERSAHLAGLKKEFLAFEQEKKDLISQLDKKDKIIASLKESEAMLTDSLQREKKIREELRITQEEKKALELKLEGLNKGVEELKERIAALGKEKETLLTQIKEQGKTIERLALKSKEREKDQGLSSTYKDEIRDLRLELRQKDTIIEELRAQISDSNQSLREVQQKLALVESTPGAEPGEMSLPQDYSILRKEKDKLLRQLREQDEIIEELEIKLKEYSGVGKYSSSLPQSETIDELTTRVRQEDQRASLLESQVVEAKLSLTQAQQKLEASLKEEESLRQRLREAEQRIKDVSKKKYVKEECATQLIDYEARVGELKQEIKDKEKMIADLQTAFKERQEVGSEQSVIKDYEQRISKLTQEIESKDSTITKLEARLESTPTGEGQEDLRTQLEMKEKEINQLKEIIKKAIARIDILSRSQGSSAY